MLADYNLTLVFASYCVATLAAYSAIYFGTRLFSVEGSTRKFWLIAGALCMGSGIWSMHFVGMSAYTMPMHMEMSFSLSMTLASWLPAVLASYLALYIIAKEQVSVLKMIISALVMGAGIASMHYGGMAAMRMEPGISYDPFWFTISLIIAVGASGAALVICRQVRYVPVKHALSIKIVAALVMGFAICGMHMHYTGMFAAVYDANAAMPASNLLRGSWMGIPTAIVTIALVLMTLYLAIADFRYIEKAAKEEEKRQQWVEDSAYYDAPTGFINRPRFEQLLIRRIAQESNEGAFGVLNFELNNFQDIAIDNEESANNIMVKFSKIIDKVWNQEESLIARYNKNSFMVLTSVLSPEQQQSLLDRIKKVYPVFTEESWSVGYSCYPNHATSSHTLIQLARKNTF